MFKSTAIVLTFIFAIGSLIDLRDLAKLPYLIHHFHQHKSKKTQFSFAEFFDLHYGQQAEEHDKEESEEHKGLPFKAPDHTSIHSTVFISEHQPVTSLLSTLPAEYTHSYRAHFSTGFHSSIFQPPRRG